MRKSLQNRHTGMDALKVLSIFAVVALHTQRCTITGEVFNPILYYFSRFAMPIFFMVNGYFILDKKEFTFEYYKKKVLNILRLLIVWGIIISLYSYFLMHENAKTAILNGIKCTLGHYIIPFWFLFTFIIIYSILLFSFDFIKKNLKKVVLLLFIFCILVDVISIFQIFNGGYFIQSNISQRYRLWTWMFYFILGYRLRNLNIELVSEKSIVISFIVLSIISVLYQYFLCNIYLRRINSEYCYDNLFIILWCISLFLLFKKHSFKSIWAINFCLPNCFGLFLLHELISKYFSLTNLISGSYFRSTIIWVLLCFIGILGTFLLKKVSFLKWFFEY